MSDIPPICRDSSGLCRMPARHEGTCDIRPPVILDYTNWKGHRRKRRVSPTGILRLANPPWHPDEEWSLSAIDHEDGKHKFFPMAKVHGWVEEPPTKKKDEVATEERKRGRYKDTDDMTGAS